MRLDRLPELHDNVVRWAVFVAAMILIALATVLAFRDQVLAGSACFVMAAMLLVFVFISRFKKFSGLGFSGELWNDKQKEAEELIGRLSQMSFAYARPLISLAAFVGRMTSGFNRTERFQLVETVTRSMRANGASDAQISDARQHFDRMISVDLMLPIHRILNEHANEAAEHVRRVLEERFPRPISDVDGYRKASEELQKIDMLRYPWSERWQNFPNKSELKFLDELVDRVKAEKHPGWEQVISKIKPLREDVEDWFNNRNLRRPEVYFSESEDA